MTGLDTEDVVLASEQLMAVSVHQGGSRKRHLPRKANVRDLYSGEMIGRAIDSFDADFAERDTRVFVIE
ncbi:MAG: hypothetical protein DRP64_07040 [Verrucomicrobia bacterium]|nr:MAG: hypothetical protein DRP64_07040 [Verrucomicrobiota bacterium]